MSLIMWLIQGVVGGFDWLFWLWVGVTVLLFLALVIPHPTFFIDTPILFIIFMILLSMLTIRGVLHIGSTVFGWLTHPAFLGFVATMLILFIYGKIKKGRRKWGRK